MGLDQRITAITPEQRAHFDHLAQGGRALDPAAVDEQEFEEFYRSLSDTHAWVGRKENHTHAWVEEVVGSEPPNCGYALLFRDDLTNLIERIDQVLRNHARAEELLPTQGGFFFGSTEYDSWYFEDLKHGREAFSAMRESMESEGGALYWCWW